MKEQIATGLASTSKLRKGAMTSARFAIALVYLSKPIPPLGDLTVHPLPH
jgi:hypothetical protein